MQSSFHVPHIPDAPVKNTIVSSYFPLWAKMVVSHAKKLGNKIGFLEFPSGFGKNDDDSNAAPLHVVRSAAEHDEIANMLVSVFSDREQRSMIRLRQSIAKIDNAEKLMYEPQLVKVISLDDFIGCMQKIRFLPSLVVFEPFSLKDLNLDLVSAHIKECNFDCIFHLHYNQLEKIIDNPFKSKHIDMAFGKAAADRLRTVAERLNPQQKESFIINTFLDGLKSLKGCHTVIVNYKIGADIHYLIFITRYVPRFRLMNEILSKAGYHKTGAFGRGAKQTEKVRPLQAGLFNV